MYLGSESKVLSIKNKVSALTYIETFMTKIENQIINKAPNYLMKGYMRFWAPIKAHLFSTRVNFIKFNFIGIIELIVHLEF